jgi:hypothetical protein
MATADPSQLRDDAWVVTVPAGWEPVAEVCRGMFEERDRITDHINSEIRREIREFETRTSVISPSDLTWSTGGGVANFLRGVAECRPAREENLSFQKLVGRRSVMRGLPLQPLITAYHVGFRELWSLLAQRAAGGEAATLLLERGSIIWERLVATAGAVAAGYQAEMARREAFEATATAHLLETLDQDPNQVEAATLAGELGFDPDGSFQVVALGGPIVAADIARSLTAALQTRGGVSSSTQRGRIAVVIAQCVEDAAINDALGDLPKGTAVGVGGRMPGLAGVRLGLIEAERALGAALARNAVCRFDDEWLLATVVSQRDFVRRILEPGIALAGSKQHLAQAVRAFAQSGFSVAEGARVLACSPNSLRYRLTRWRTLTGWDPWTFDGLSRSLLALELAGSSSADDG